MRKNTLLTGSIALSLFFSCTKHDNQPNNTNDTSLQKGPLRKTVIRTLQNAGVKSTDTTNYSYDQQGRIALVQAGKTKTLFIYDAGGNYTQDIYQNDTLYLHLTVFVAGGNIDSLVQSDGFNTYTQKYLYNAGRVMTMSNYTYTPAGGSHFDNQLVFTWDSSGNIIRQEQKTIVGTSLSIYTYAYQHNPSRYSNAYLGYLYVSPTSNDLNSVANVLSGAGAVVSSIKYSYEFDSQNRVVKEVLTYSSGPVTTYSITYY